MKVLVTGAAGLVGRATVSSFTTAGDDVTGLDRNALDISDVSAVRATVETQSPDVVINCAAWTDVDGCEFDPQRAMSANALGPELLALACRKVGALFITISTDYVFDGEKEGFYTQRDQPNPLGVYGASKLDGERRAQTNWARTIVVRSGYIFGAGGTNFLSTFLDRARRGQHLKVIDDSFGTPTYAAHLAERFHRLAELDLPGIYHIVNAGEGASFAQVAETAFEKAGLDRKLLENISVDSLSRPAPRPRNSRLRCLLSEAIGMEPMPYWRDAICEFAEETPAASPSEAS